MTDTRQLVDGTWQITYKVAVTNQSDSVAAIYSLNDTLTFGGDITVVDASWTGPTSGTFVGVTGALATNRMLAPSGIDTYTVAALATIPAAAYTTAHAGLHRWRGTDSRRVPQFATVTVNGIAIPANDCSQPTQPTITKAGVSAIGHRPTRRVAA